MEYGLKEKASERSPTRDPTPADKIAEAIADHIKERFIPEIKERMKQAFTQGQMELASALFTGNTFVPYGPGQWPGPQREGGHSPPPQQEQERSR
jgi:hypothetical protein